MNAWNFNLILIVWRNLTMKNATFAEKDIFYGKSRKGVFKK